MKTISMKKTMVTVYSIIHFIVDLACAILVTNFLRYKTAHNFDLYTAAIIYNFFAFAMQLPLGVIVDALNKNAVCAAVGCALVALGFCLARFGMAACVIAGLGNAMFHLGGGIDVLNISNKKASLSGIFVSTGALGVFLGSASYKAGFKSFSLIFLILIFSAVCLIRLYALIKNRFKNQKVVVPKLTAKAWLVVFCLVITVSVRSYVGLILSFKWKSEVVFAVLSVMAVVLGKMAGGIIGDKISFKKLSVFSLTMSAICFAFAFKSAFFGISAIFLFNMTMPITLTALSNILENNKGMAFGMLTLALFAGALPYYFSCFRFVFSPLGLFVICICSMFILYYGLKVYNRIAEKNK